MHDLSRLCLTLTSNILADFDISLVCSTFLVLNRCIYNKSTRLRHFLHHNNQFHVHSFFSESKTCPEVVLALNAVWLFLAFVAFTHLEVVSILYRLFLYHILHALQKIIKAHRFS
jgi:hypothetical protein